MIFFYALLSRALVNVLKFRILVAWKKVVTNSKDPDQTEKVVCLIRAFSVSDFDEDFVNCGPVNQHFILMQVQEKCSKL